MKTSEFIKTFNKLVAPIYIAERKENEKDGRSVVINCPDYCGKLMTKARLIEGGKVWDIGGLFDAKMLELMAELAKTPPEEREEQPKYVILNGKPFLLEGKISTRVFLSNEGNLSFATVSLDEMINFSYTKAELEQMKATLPKNLQEAVDLLTVTVDEAKKMLKNDDD